MSSAALVAISPHSDLFLWRKDEAIFIHLAIPGEVVPLRISESDSIENVKLRIQSYKGFVVRNQKLVCGGRELSRSNSLVKDYGVGDGNVVHLVVRVSDLQCISVKTSCGKDFTFHVEKNHDVAYANDSREYDLAVRQLKDGAHGIEYYGSVPKEAAKRNLWLEPVIVNPEATIPSVLLDLINSTYEGLRNGNNPIRSSEGTGGAYLMLDASGTKYLSVFKPIDEEPMAVNNPRDLPLSVDGEGLKKGTTVGEGALREVAAYILDHPKGERGSLVGERKGFSGVPPTFMATCLHKGFNHPDGVKEKIGSLQMFMENNGSCEDIGPSAFPVEEVHKIAVLDMRLANADRHAGNILVSKGEDGKVVLIPIDHGYCLPTSFEDCTFDWLYWPQARKPFSPETVDYIESLDVEEDIALLKFYGWRNLTSECERTFRISTMLLKKGVKKGLTPFTIGNIMCRENINKQSVIEKIVQEAEELILPGMSEAAFIEAVSQIMDKHLDSLS